jgi:hypothetical protein
MQNSLICKREKNGSLPGLIQMNKASKQNEPGGGNSPMSTSTGFLESTFYSSLIIRSHV